MDEQPAPTAVCVAGGETVSILLEAAASFGGGRRSFTIFIVDAAFANWRRIETEGRPYLCPATA